MRSAARRSGIPLALMRTTWNGSLSFGLVSIPVGLAPATKPGRAAVGRLRSGSCTASARRPIKQKRWCPTHDREVSQDEIVRGFEVAEGPVPDRRGRRPRGNRARGRLRARSRSRASSRRTTSTRSSSTGRYFLVPRRPPRSGGRTCCCSRPCGRPSTAALGRFVRAGRESLCLVRAKGDALALETLFLAEDVYSQAEISEAVEDDHGEEDRARRSRAR